MLLAQRRRGLLRQAVEATIKARHLPICRRPSGRHQPLLQGNKPDAKALHMDRRSRQDHRRRQARASSVRFYPLADKYPEISFISFADSLLLKSNWRVGYVDRGVKDTYEPEKIINLIRELGDIYREVLAMEIYAVLTQGSNEYYDDDLLHTSPLGNHVCLNSLGLPSLSCSRLIAQRGTPLGRGRTVQRNSIWTRVTSTL